MRWLRRLRGAIGMGLTWALAWAPVGGVFRLIFGKGGDDVPFPIVFGLVGFMAGVTFSGVLAIVGRRRGFDQLSLPRFAGWGGLGGLVLYGAFALTAGPGGEPLFFAPLFVIAGAGSAAGTLAVARKAGERESLDAAGGTVERFPTEDQMSRGDAPPRKHSAGAGSVGRPIRRPGRGPRRRPRASGRGPVSAR